jgi:RNA polymerase sigma factor (TIGR02999 family)
LATSRFLPAAHARAHTSDRHGRRHAAAARRQRGDPAAYDRLFAITQTELQQVAERQLRRGGARAALDPAELVSELYLKLRDQLRGEWVGRAHFYGVAARAMRQILVDWPAGSTRQRGGGDWQPTTLTGKPLPQDVALEDVLALEAALEQLDERQRRVVELRFLRRRV